jgi:hypothetical protein
VILVKKFISVLLVISIVFAFAVSASARYLGDINSDGKVNSSDALAVLQYAVGSIKTIDKAAADVNGDGGINSSDALLILQTSVGKYKPIEMPDDFKTSYKADVVDPIMSTGRYTLKTEVMADGKQGIVTIMVRDGDICVDTETGGMFVRLLCLDNKTYMVFPDFVKVPVVGTTYGIYMESDKEITANVGNAADAKYVKSEKVKVDGVEYVCETYELSDGTISNYYFKDGKWKMLGTTENGETNIQKITEFKKGVNDKNFSLDGYVKVESSK